MVVDAGNLLWKSPRIDEPVEREAKAKLIAEATLLAGIDAMLPSVGEFAFGREFLTELELPYVVSNLDCQPALPFPRTRIVGRITVVGIVGNDLKVEGCHVTEPSAVFADLEGDVVIALSGQSAEQDRTLAAQAARLDFIVNGRDRDQLAAPELMPNGVLRLGAGSRGKQLGALTFERVSGGKGWRDEGIAAKAATDRDHYAARVKELKDRLAGETEERARARYERQIVFMTEQVTRAEQSLVEATKSGGLTHSARNELLEMDRSISDHPATQKLVDATKAAISGQAVSAPYVGPFAGSEVCAACHPVEHAQWKTTPHAHAWETLVTSTRQNEADCWTCHSTGGLHADGPRSAAAAIRDVGCESCHGPAKGHAASPMTTRPDRDPPQELCVTCHDAENDMGRFDWATYRPRVVHK